MRSFNRESYPDEKIDMNDIEVLGRIVFSQRGM